MIEKIGKIWNKLSDLGKFFGHYANEAGAIADGLRVIVNSLPLTRGDKAKVQGVIDKLDNAVDNITDHLTNNPHTGEIVVKSSDVKAAVTAYFKTAAGKKVIADAVKNAGAEK